MIFNLYYIQSKATKAYYNLIWAQVDEYFRKMI